MLRIRSLLTAVLMVALIVPVGALPAAAQEPIDPAAVTFATARAEVDEVIAAGGINDGLAAKLHHALDQAEAWMPLYNKRGPAMSHLARAIHLLEWQVGVIEGKNKPNQGDPAALRYLTDFFKELERAYTIPTGPSKNIEFIRNLRGLNGITSINMVYYDDRDVLIAVGRFGLRTFDMTNPESPEALDHLTSEELRLPGIDTSGTFWQSESTNVDQNRKLVFLSRDPRAYGGNQDNPNHKSGVYIIDAADPTDLKLVKWHEIPAGHTSTCINDCQFLWTGGPARRADMPADWGGRPIYVTDIRDPQNPYTYPDPIDIGRNQGITDYAHDVQVDNMGIAWVSGRGAVRGYWTQGMHWDPVRQENRMASAWDPVPYAGGGGPQVWSNTGPAVMHNSERPVGDRPAEPVNQRDSERTVVPYAEDGSDYEKYGFEPGQLLYTTHEDFNGSCAQRGRFYIVDLAGSYNGESWRATQDNPFRLNVVSSWHPFEQEGYVSGTNDCSGHYFRMDDGLVYMSWYGQGTRVLDVRNPYEPTQVAYFRPQGTSSYTTMTYKGLLIVADSGRGIDILRLDDDTYSVAERGEDVIAPTITQAELAAQTIEYVPDPVLGWLCRIPADA